MVENAPSSVDLQEFQFKLHSKLKIFETTDDWKFKNALNLVASSSRYGLVFVGTPNGTLEVIQLKAIESITASKVENSNFPKRSIPLQAIPSHLAVNCDQTLLAVICYKNGCATAIVYHVPSFLSQNVAVTREIRVSATPGVQVLEAGWNPTVPGVLTACKADGSLGVYNINENSVDINELPVAAAARCFCWSPKGKQLVVGSTNGSLTQYKPDLKAVKMIPAPALGSAGPYCVLNIFWVSNYQFTAVYQNMGEAEVRPVIVMVNAPRTGPTMYINYEDICYSYGTLRPPQYYIILQPTWGVMIVASANSMEVGVLGITSNTDPALWQQWNQIDAARAELPLSATRQETFPIGVAMDTGVTMQLPWGENQALPPMPMIHLLSHHGVLCSFSVINVRQGAQCVCNPPESVADLSGLGMFQAAPIPSSVSGGASVASSTGGMQQPSLGLGQAPAQPVMQVKPQPVQQAFGSLASSTPSFGSAPAFGSPVPAFESSASLTPFGGITSSTASPISFSSLGAKPPPPAYTSPTPVASPASIPSSGPPASLPPTAMTSAPLGAPGALLGWTAGSSLFGNSTPSFGNLVSQPPATTSAAFSFKLASAETSIAKVASPIAPIPTTPVNLAPQSAISSVTHLGNVGISGTAGSTEPVIGTSVTIIGGGGTVGTTGGSNLLGGISITPSSPSMFGSLASTPTSTLNKPAGNMFNLAASPAGNANFGSLGVTKPATQNIPSLGSAITITPVANVSSANVPSPVPLQNIPQSQQTSSAAPAVSKPLLSTPKQLPKPEIPSQNVSTTKNETIKDDSTISDHMMHSLIKEEVKTFQMELQELFQRFKTIKLDVGTDEEKTNLVLTTESLLEFHKELQETTDSQVAEIHYLKQALMQSFAWCEDTKARHRRYNDPNFTSLLQAQDLDPVSEKQLGDIKHLIYYIEAQLKQVDSFLDNQWADFQDSCKKHVKGKLHIPTLEPVYQALVRQNAILDRHKYILKDIAARVKSRNKKFMAQPHVMNLNLTDNKSQIKIEEELRKLQLDHGDLFTERYNKIVAEEKKFSEVKQSKLCSFFTNRNVTHISPKKPKFVNTPSKISSFLNSPGVQRNLLQTFSKMEATNPSVETNLSANNLFSFNLLEGAHSTKLQSPDKSTQQQPKPASNLMFSAPKSAANAKISANLFNMSPASSSPGFNFNPPTSIQNKPIVFGSDLSSQTLIFSGGSKPIAKPNTTSFTAAKPAEPKEVELVLIKPNVQKSTAENLPMYHIPQTQPFSFIVPQAKPTGTSAGTSSVKPTTIFTDSSAIPPSKSASFATPRDSLEPGFNFGSALSLGQQSTPKPKSPNTINFGTMLAQVSSSVNTTASTVKPVNTVVSTQIVVPKPTFALAQSSSTTITPIAPVPPVMQSSSPVSQSPTSSVTVSTAAEAVVTAPSSTISSPSIFGGVTAAKIPSSGTVFGQQATLPASSAAGSFFGGISSGQTAVSPLSSSMFSAKVPQEKPSIFSAATLSTASPSVTPATLSSAGNLASPTATLVSSPATLSASPTSGSEFSFAKAAAETANKSASSNIFGGAAAATATANLFGGVATSSTASNFSFLQQPASSLQPAASSPQPAVSNLQPITSSVQPVVSSLQPAASSVANSSQPATSNLQQAVSSSTTASSVALNLVTPKITSVYSEKTDEPAANTLAISEANIATNIGASPAAIAASIAASTAANIASSSATGFVETKTTSSFGFGTLADSLTSPTADNKFSFGNLTVSALSPNSATSPASTTVSTASSAAPGFGFGSSLAATSTTTVTTTSSSAFGGFGGTSSFMGQPICSPSSFTQPQTGSPFGQTTGNIFAQKPATPAAGGSIFGQQSSGGVFGQTANNPVVTSAASSSIFGQNQNQNSPFGAQTTAGSTGGGSIFGQTSAFGANNPSTTSGSIFGQSSFGSPASTSAATPGSFSFTQAAGQAQTSSFGTSGGSIFAKPAFGGAPAFGQSTFGAPPAFGGNPPTGSVFGSPAPSNSPGNTFGTGFGSPSSFGQKSTFGSPPSFGQQGAFGSPPAFGGSPGFGSPQRVFGNTAPPQTTGTFGGAQENSTFANLATQTTIGFGSLVQNQQQAPQQQPQQPQFSGGAQFSSWR